MLIAPAETASPGSTSTGIDSPVIAEVSRLERPDRTIPSVAIAGYTNAGKSSLLNRLTRAGVLVENALFATLDTSVRRSETADGRVYTLTDTVGFVRNLPHQLVEAFRSTLEEVGDAGLPRPLVFGADVVPQVDGHDGGRSVRTDDHP